MRQVIDTRFLVEHFYSRDKNVVKKTKAKLKELRRKGEGILPTIVISEIVKITCERRGREEAKIRYASLLRSGLEIKNLDPDVAEMAGLLKCKYENVPMGDCIVAAIAMIGGASVLSDDHHFDVIKEVKRIWI